jgi:hypothetical protein
MKYWILILLPAFLLITAPVTYAHNLLNVNGSSKDHQHVYRHQQYGKPLQQGHVVQSAGGNGTILWGSDMRPEYGKSNVRRTGPIIDGRHQKAGAGSNPKRKFGSAVNAYGKPVQGYGKPVQGYGKPRHNW